MNIVHITFNHIHMITKPPVSPAHKPSESSEQPIVDATLARIRTKVSELLSHSATQG